MNSILKFNVRRPISRSLRRLLWAGLLACHVSAHALVIVPTFDSSITSDPNAAAIESAINTAIQFYEARIADPITVTILFQEITTAGLYGHSQWWYYNISYSQFRAALQNDAFTTNDTVALAHLTSGTKNPATGSGTVRVKTANLRAIGITGLNSGLTGGYDGIIGLHTSQLNLSRATINVTKGDLLATVEHEMDEVLGLCSGLDSGSTDPFPEDLFRYNSTGSRSYTTTGDDAYFSIDGTTLLARFNQTAGNDFGDWWTAGAHVAQVQDGAATNGKTPNPKTELVALDVIGYNVLPVRPPTITHIALSGTQLVLNGANGLASASYVLLSSTDPSLALTQWTRGATNTLATNGNFTWIIPNAVNLQEPKRFFALQVEL